uniref:Vacuolar protein sorting-associated protein 26 n=1 Tax=Oryza glumipatula TaxID=40148 RepID=A0A0E0BLE3_9ORYZ
MAHLINGQERTTGPRVSVLLQVGQPTQLDPDPPSHAAVDVSDAGDLLRPLPSPAAAAAAADPPQLGRHLLRQRESPLHLGSCSSNAAMNYIIGAFKAPCDVFITFADERSRKQVAIKKDNGKTLMVPAFQSLETIAGEVSVAPVPGKRVEHQGVKIELLGQIELYHERGHFYDFTSLVRELEVAGEIYERKTYPFEFSTVEMPYESYNGTNVRLRYILKVTIGRPYATSVVECRDFCVRNYTPLPSINNSIKMEVGIEDCLHIEFEYSKSKIKIKNMELEIRRRESTGSGPGTYIETETLAKFELMDGAPVRGESIPVRLFLTPYELTPTYRNINNKFNVKYYLNLVLVDEEDRRYFKQQEITMYRLQETPQSS